MSSITKSAPRSSSSRSTKSAPKASAASKTQKPQQTQRTQKNDRASVSKDAAQAQPKNPVNFGSWSGGLLKSGSKGADVAAMQKSLNEKTGGNIKVDGKFGKETRAAVEKFQQQSGLKTDGLAGDNTREALMGHAPKQPQAQTPGGNQPSDAAKAPGKVEGPAQSSATQKVDPKSSTPSGFGDKLAKDARRIAESGVAGSGRNCKRGVRMALEKQGMKLDGVSAYMAAGQLAKNKNFQEAKGLSRQDLKDLPPGATVVWNKGPGHPHGHISIAQGNGREASDVMRNQITNYPSSYRVFMPQG